MDRQQTEGLKQTANRARRRLLESGTPEAADFWGGSLSSIDILVALFFPIFRYDSGLLPAEARDRFILSKGHAANALQAVLAQRGVSSVDPVVDSPGLGLSVAVGTAIGMKLKGAESRVYVLMGDGETQSGAVWEAASLAARRRLDNLVGILDYNRLQQYGTAGILGYRQGDRIPPLENPRARWEAFGWYVMEADGHNLVELVNALSTTRQIRGRPTVVVAKTVKGKGVSFMENRWDWHFRILAPEERAAAIAELEAEDKPL